MDEPAIIAKRATWEIAAAIVVSVSLTVLL